MNGNFQVPSKCNRTLYYYEVIAAGTGSERPKEAKRIRVLTMNNEVMK